MPEGETPLTRADVATLQYLTLREVAGILRVSVETVRKECEAGRLRSTTYGGGEKRKHRRVHVDWLAEYQRRRAEAGRGAASSRPVELLVRVRKSGRNLLGLPG